MSMTDVISNKFLPFPSKSKLVSKQKLFKVPI